MPHPRCPDCGARLAATEPRSGGCKGCGQAAPAYARRAGPFEPPVPSAWAVLGGAAVAGAGVLLLWLTLTAGPPAAPDRSRRVRTVEPLLGEKGAGVLCGLVLIGAGGFVAVRRPAG